MSQETYELDDVTLIVITDLARLVRITGVEEEDAEEGEDEWWIPKSHTESTDLDRVGDEGYIELPEWMATKKGMI